MENKDRYLHFIFDSNVPVYLKENVILDIINNYPHFRINGNIQTSFSEQLQDFINSNQTVKKMFIIINIDNINVDNQKILSYMVKDKYYQTVSLPDNCKIIVTGNKDSMDKELFGLLTVI